jgi:hypothetical protein
VLVGLTLLYWWLTDGIDGWPGQRCTVTVARLRAFSYVVAYYSLQTSELSSTADLLLNA